MVNLEVRDGALLGYAGAVAVSVTLCCGGATGGCAAVYFCCFDMLVIHGCLYARVLRFSCQ